MRPNVYLRTVGQWGWGRFGRTRYGGPGYAYGVLQKNDNIESVKKTPIEPQLLKVKKRRPIRSLVNDRYRKGVFEYVYVVIHHVRA